MKMRISLTVAVLAMGGVLLDSAMAQRSVADRVRVFKGEGLISALQEPVPPVVIHEAVFGRPVQLFGVQALDAYGTEIGAVIELEAAGAGIVIDNFRAFRVDTGDRIEVGDFVVGGVVANAGETAVLLTFAGAHDIFLGPGERLYVGTEERLLREADEKGSALTAKATPKKPGTHCPVCSCTCTCTGGGHCTITYDTTSGADVCALGNSNGCVCPAVSGQPDCNSGTTSGCSRVFVPCEPEPEEPTEPQG